MFTGIVERTVHVAGVAEGPMFRRLTLPKLWDDVKHGESIAINGVCLTIADMTADTIAFDVIKETLSKTNLGLIGPGDEVHVERALRVGDRLDGHFVQGHVDATALLVRQVSNGDEWRLTIEPPHHLAKYIVPKGSVTIDGVSLTVAAVTGSTFEVALIPTTLNVTALGRRNPGWPCNLEVDVISKTIVHYLEMQRGS